MINHTLAERIVSEGNYVLIIQLETLHSSGLLHINYPETVSFTRIILVLHEACMYEIPRASTARTA